MVNDPILTVEEVGEYLKIPKQTLYLWARTGAIPAVKVGKHWRFKRSSIDIWIEEKEKESQHKI
ncbi:MAG: DNA-binding protein [Candidatus Omnitrophica bacterium CG11_big_fil_rev_8_21_14_0_20_42_13]|uniref:DNA-binding protein n=1 Tax=Candidatus Ghiorseimicrobium undicola TaxID=1974746 RepID=A0A2H0LXZ3_9BACT|nr:MAG: DNA-binding protein [Candidatus Omnitrophica bacterium CG11_big_fil_rev_8_21_14_0_20_42_13]